MAIQLPDPGTGVPADKTGDSPWLAMKKVRENFTDQTNAASKLVGDEVGKVPVVSTYGIMNTGVGGKGRYGMPSIESGGIEELAGGYFYRPNADRPDDPDMTYLGPYDNSGIVIPNRNPAHGGLLYFPSQITNNKQNILFYQAKKETDGSYTKYYHVLYTSMNTTKDSNGFIKASSPVLRVFSDHIEGNADGEKLGATFIKNGIGDYLIKGTTGLSNDGWYIELPQDANKNPLVAVEYKDLGNGDISVKTYKRTFSMETFMFTPDKSQPLDIPDTRWIDLRFNDLPIENLDNVQTEV